MRRKLEDLVLLLREGISKLFPGFGKVELLRVVFLRELDGARGSREREKGKKYLPSGCVYLLENPSRAQD